MAKEETERCDECGSTYFVGTSQMASLCPECAHWLYGYPNCDHVMVAGRCTRCHWNGKSSDYVAGLRSGS